MGMHNSTAGMKLKKERIDLYNASDCLFWGFFF